MNKFVSRFSLWGACVLPLLATTALLTSSCAAQPGPLVPATQVSASATNPDTVSHTFTYVPDAMPVAQSVTVVGTFNNWDKAALPMTKDADGKTWRVTTPLPYGKLQYKFVINNDKYVTDPAAERNEDDGGGNINSILIVRPADYNEPAKVGDGSITRSALQHTNTPPFLNYDRGQLSLSFRVRPGDVEGVTAIVGDKRYPLKQQAEDELYARYSAPVAWDRKHDLNYSFELVDGGKTFRYGADGLSTAPTPFQLKSSTYKPFVVPGWVEKTVFYQIFPDRYDNGDKKNDPKDVQNWDAKPEWFNRFGGDAAGVEKHVNYLSSLGVGSVYFNPVFQSPSNHRYDAQDYKRVDPQFGTNEEFIRLTKDLQAHGIRTVMDFVFNHSATNFFAFQDVRDKGAASTYKDWYFINSYPVRIGENPNYQAWYGFASMPKLNVMNPPTHEYLLGLVNFWKSQIPLSGMRLDVANEVDPRFWKDLRVKAKGIDPNLWIVGEVWGDGSPWLKGDQWDSVMNYQFRDACLRFFAEEKTTPTQFMNRLVALDKSYAPQVSRNMMNLLSSHDTPRFLTQCKGNAAMHRLAATLQFTWVGAPSIYYGEEIGMEGGPDPENRRGMQWSKATNDNPMLRYYKTLIATRNKSRALQSGDATILLTNDAEGTLAFSRTLDTDVAIVALNRSSETRTVTIPQSKVPGNLANGKQFIDALTGKAIPQTPGTVLTVILAPLTSAVLITTK